MNLVMGFGTFDLLHPGHLFYLRELKKLGNQLIVVIARDQNVERIKGKKPFHNEQERLTAVERTYLADQVVLGHPTDFYEVIRQHRPQILGFGYDQQVNETDLRKQFPEIKFIRLKSHYPEKFKTSLIKSQKKI